MRTLVFTRVNGWMPKVARDGFLIVGQSTGQPQLLGRFDGHIPVSGDTLEVIVGRTVRGGIAEEEGNASGIVQQILRLETSGLVAGAGGEVHPLPIADLIQLRRVNLEG